MELPTVFWVQTRAVYLLLASMTSLIDRLSKGDPDAFAELYDLLGGKLYRYAHSILGNGHDAAEVTQDVFSRLFQFHRHFLNVKHLDAYIFKIAHNESIRKISKSTRGLKAIPETAEFVFPTMEQLEWISTVLEQLDPIDRDIVRYKIFGELTFSKIGTIVDMPTASVATRYRRALRRLQDIIERQEIESKRG